MVFSSIPFLFYFLPLFFILYYVTPFSLKNGVLLIFSLIFYAWGEPVYIILMIVETLSDYIIARLMEKKPDKSKARKMLLFTSVFIDLAILMFFKYADFLVNTVNGIFKTQFTPLGLGLPVGISFFTFQTLSYVIDVYKGRVEVEKNYGNYLAYVSMFPQLIAGPIVRFSTVNEELHKRDVNWENASAGFYRFMQGLLKKVLIANQIGALYESINTLPHENLTVSLAWLGAIAFTFQIYFDFSAYSDMAIGMGQMMGFHFNENFNYPLTADSITDFWRRWHISLSTWFRDYVYIPLGGNRVGVLRHIRNICVVWLLTGFWHGASWNYVMWGVYYGILLLLEKYVWGSFLEKWPKVLKHIYAYIIVVVGFVIFSHEEMSSLRTFGAAMLGLNGAGFISAEILSFVMNNIVILILCVLLMGPWFNQFVAFVRRKAGKVDLVLTPVVMFLLTLVAVAFLVNDSYNPFLYFRF